MKQGGNAAAQGTKMRASFLHGNSDKLSRSFKIHASIRGTKLVMVTVFILSYFTDIREASIFSVSLSDKYYT